MGSIITLWGTLPLTLYCFYVFGLNWSSEANVSSSLSGTMTDTEYRLRTGKNNSKFRSGHPQESLFRTRDNVPIVNFSQEENNFPKIRSIDHNDEAFGGFEFVDSPYISTDVSNAITKINGGVDADVGRSTVGGPPLSSRIGANRIDKNLWKTYRNGTIIHDVHISFVHPANMVGIMNDGNPNPDGSASAEPVHSTSDSKMKSNTTSEGRASPEPGVRHSNYDTNNSTMIPFESALMGGNSSIITDNRSDSVYGSTILSSMTVTNTPPTDVGLATEEGSINVSTSFSTAGQLNSDGKFQPVINLGVSINTKGTCLSDCLTKCDIADSRAVAGLNQATCLPSEPSCLPLLVESVKGKLDSGSDSIPEETNASTTARVPILPLHEVRLLKIKESAEPKLGFLLEDICFSESCVLKAADVLRRMEKSVDPCDSFYEFACGGYFKNEIPDGESSRSIFADISSDILARMYSILKSPILVDDHPSVNLLKKFYGKCVLTSPKELFMDAVKEVGGWPSLYPSQRAPQRLWGEIAFNWTYGMFLEYNLISINLTFASEKDKWMLHVDYPWFVKLALHSDSLSVLDEMERDIRKVASTLGIDNSITRSVLLDLRILMGSAIKFANATMSSDAEKGVYFLKDLKTKFIHLDLMKKLPSLLETIIVIDDNEMVHVNNMMYLRKVDDLLRDSTVRTQGAHLVLTALRSLSVLIGTATDSVMEKYCVKLTAKLFPHLFNNLYSATFVSDAKVASATRIASQIRDSLLNMLDENVSGTTLNKITDKIKKLVFIWSNRNEVNYDLNGIARGFDENPSFLGFVKTGIWNLKKVTYTYLHQRVNSTLASFIERYSGDDYGVNAFYYSHHVLIPSSALHENIFDPDVPPYVSFGGLGLIVGHELLHSVIAASDILNTANYKNMEKCMINQFNKFTKKDSEDRVNGFLTKDENIADYGGFKIAYRAFMEWYKHSSKESKEKRLPGLQKFNEKQMFWLTSATNWCQMVSPNVVSTSVDRHAPPEYRVDGQFANLPEFAQDFNCPENSPMNPKEKCSLR